MLSMVGTLINDPLRIVARNTGQTQQFSLACGVQIQRIVLVAVPSLLHALGRRPRFLGDHFGCLFELLTCLFQRRLCTLSGIGYRFARLLSTFALLLVIGTPVIRGAAVAATRRRSYDRHGRTQ